MLKGISAISLLQISTSTHCVIYYLNRLQDVPPRLESLLADPDVVKTGVGVVQDAVQISDQYGCDVRGLFDLHTVSHELKLPHTGMKALTFALLGINMKSGKKTTMSNWDRRVLSAEQVSYAATDAFLSLWLYRQFLLQRFAGTLPAHRLVDVGKSGGMIFQKGLFKTHFKYRRKKIGNIKSRVVRSRNFPKKIPADKHDYVPLHPLVAKHLKGELFAVLNEPLSAAEQNDLFHACEQSGVLAFSTRASGIKLVRVHQQLSFHPWLSRL